MYDIRGIDPVKVDTIWVSYAWDVFVCDMMGCYSGEILGAHIWVIYSGLCDGSYFWAFPEGRMWNMGLYRLLDGGV